MGERLEDFRPEQDSNPDLCDAAAMLYHLSYEANWDLVVMRFNVKPIDSTYCIYDVMNI